MKNNYELKMLEQIKGVKPNTKLLLHSCCAPCSSAVIERLKDFFDLTIYYYNPNIDNEQEFAMRAREQERLCKELDVKFICPTYDKNEFYKQVSGLENEKEGGARCEKCFFLRLGHTANFAKSNGFEYFATTLTVSPLKNAELLNSIGEDIGKQLGINYLYSDFKKKGGYLRSIELSKQFGLYRQNYCGCSFSKKAND